ncbi:MAG: hypothetical protein R6U46_09195 [Marinilabilia sp.]
MDKNFLLKSAETLKQISSESAGEYYQKSDRLIAAMNGQMLQRADLDNLVGRHNIDMMKDNHANHVRFMASIFHSCNSEVLVETILWVFRAYRTHGFSTSYWAAQLNTWMGVLKEVLSEECYSEIHPYYEWMQVNVPVFVKLTDESLDQQWV